MTLWHLMYLLLTWIVLHLPRSSILDIVILIIVASHHIDVDMCQMETHNHWTNTNPMAVFLSCHRRSNMNDRKLVMHHSSGFELHLAQCVPSYKLTRLLLFFHHIGQLLHLKLNETSFNVVCVLSVNNLTETNHYNIVSLSDSCMRAWVMNTGKTCHAYENAVL